MLNTSQMQSTERKAIEPTTKPHSHDQGHHHHHNHDHHHTTNSVVRNQFLGIRIIARGKKYEVS